MRPSAQGFPLHSGAVLPAPGFGTWRLRNDSATRDAIVHALQAGYRHIDTSRIDGTEEAVGDAIRASGIPRSEIFVSTKLWNTDRGYNAALDAFERSLENLGLESVDLFLLQWPAARGEPMTWQSINTGAWRAMEHLYRTQRVRAIGVSNFLLHHLVPLLARADIVPMVNQIECHPGYTQFSTVRFCQNHGIQVAAWSPLGHGALLWQPALIRLAGRYGVSPAQLCLRWCLEHGIAPVTRSLTPEHQIENLRIFDWSIDPADMAVLDTLPRMGFSGLDPDHVTF